MSALASVIMASLSSPSNERLKTLRLLEKHDFGDGRARLEAIPEAHQDHLTDVTTVPVELGH